MADYSLRIGPTLKKLGNKGLKKLSNFVDVDRGTIWVEKVIENGARTGVKVCKL